MSPVFNHVQANNIIPFNPFTSIQINFPLEMEAKRQSASFPPELFGNKDPHGNDVFASIFPPSKGMGRNSAGSEHSSGFTRRDDVDKNGQQPCHMSSSLYYGGRESYSQSQSSHASGSYTTTKKDGGENDPTGASRGNWWQGSLYY